MLKCESVAPFGDAGRSARELDVDRVVGIERAGQRVEPRALRRAGEREQPAVRQAARRHRLVAEQDDVLELGQADAVEHLARALEMDLGRDLAEHAEIVAALEAARHDERAAADLGERVLELGRAIRRIDVDQDEADPRRRELGDEPLVPVRRPDADAVAAPQAEREQARGHLVGALLAGRTTTGAASRRRRSPRRAGRGGETVLSSCCESVMKRSGSSVDPDDVRERSLRPQPLVAAAGEPVGAERIRRHGGPRGRSRRARSCASRRAARRRARRGRSSTRRSARRPAACRPAAPPTCRTARSSPGGR